MKDINIVSLINYWKQFYKDKPLPSEKCEFFHDYRFSILDLIAYQRTLLNVTTKNKKILKIDFFDKDC